MLVANQRAGRTLANKELFAAAIILLMADRESQYFVKNFGCRATQADGAAIEQYLTSRGLQRASSEATAAVVVFNSCTVTAAADADLRASVRQVHRENPAAKILVTGCYAQRAA